LAEFGCSQSRDRRNEWAVIRRGDNTRGEASTPRGATLDVQLVCRETTKYAGMGMLHKFLRDDSDFGRT
jgi:hypothetical protein